MRPIPVAFHIWFIEVHTYGIGLALTFWFGLRYTERRLRNAGYAWQWVTGMFLWVIVAAIVGARAMHVIANLGAYDHDPIQVIAIWQGGLSSFGGLIAAIPVGVIVTRRRCPELPISRFFDMMAPVLVGCWALGRLLGPQLMVAGGGHPTTQWFGMYYADQVGKRLPVPIFQSVEDCTVFVVLLLTERWLVGLDPSRRGSGGRRASDVLYAPPEPTDTMTSAAARPNGVVIGMAMVLWGIERFADQRLWLSYPDHLGSELVQLAGIGLVLAGLALLATRIRPLRAWRESRVTRGAARAGEMVSPPTDSADEAVGPSVGAAVGPIVGAAVCTSPEPGAGSQHATGPATPS